MARSGTGSPGRCGAAGTSTTGRSGPHGRGRRIPRRPVSRGGHTQRAERRAGALGDALPVDDQSLPRLQPCMCLLLRQELARPSWRGEQVALGTNTDPYQRAEGRYRLMPGIIAALAGSGTPLSILTKGTVLSRDLDLLAAASASVAVGMGVSLALLDPELQSTLEPGTPTPRARLE